MNRECRRLPATGCGAVSRRERLLLFGAAVLSVLAFVAWAASQDPRESRCGQRYDRVYQDDAYELCVQTRGASPEWSG